MVMEKHTVPFGLKGGHTPITYRTPSAVKLIELNIISALETVYDGPAPILCATGAISDATGNILARKNVLIEIVLRRACRLKRTNVHVRCYLVPLRISQYYT